jgi:hypothetical protein
MLSIESTAMARSSVPDDLDQRFAQRGLRPMLDFVRQRQRSNGVEQCQSALKIG